MTLLFIQQIPMSAWRLICENNKFKHTYRKFMSKFDFMASAVESITGQGSNKDPLVLEARSDIRDLQWQLVSIQVSFITVAAFGGMMPVLTVIALPGLFLQYFAIHWVRRTQELTV